MRASLTGSPRRASDAPEDTARGSSTPFRAPALAASSGKLDRRNCVQNLQACGRFCEGQLPHPCRSSPHISCVPSEQCETLQASFYEELCVPLHTPIHSQILLHTSTHLLTPRSHSSPLRKPLAPLYDYPTDTSVPLYPQIKQQQDD